MAGVDEAGRGCLAGPVVAACVLFDGPRGAESALAAYDGLTDSKQLTARQRDGFFERLTRDPGVRWAVGRASVAEIDRWNILRANDRAMARAVRALRPPPDFLLVDGRPVPGLPLPSRAIVKGDALSLSIAAASVIAKVTRDRLMKRLDRRFPLYGFAVHKGYGTAEHLAALRRHGPCPHHRRSFRPVADCDPAGRIVREPRLPGFDADAAGGGR